MDNSIYITLSRQMGLFREMDVRANNIANANTTGFNTETMLFRNFLVDDGNHNKMAFSQDVATYRDTTNGPMRLTNNPFDLAIEGKGYFTVETPQGQRYTRAGSFQIDPEGTLVTVQGYPVLDNAGQRITIQPEDRDVKIGDNGLIIANGEERGQIALVQFENDQVLERVGNTMFRADVQPREAEGARMAQGMLEGSNVQPVTELTNILRVSRSVASTAKFIDTMYELERRASNVITDQG